MSATGQVTGQAGRTFDWAPRHDPRSRRYGVTETIPTPVPPRRRMWRGGPVLDQAAEGACVGFACVAEASASPVRVRGASDAAAYAWYRAAQRMDDWVGENYSGTSVLAGMQVGRQLGLYDGYRWAFGVDDVQQAVIQLGPVVIGVPWTEGMYDTDPGGLVRVGGRPVGGHCLLLTGYYPTHPVFGEVYRWRNSWGRSYGVRGNGWVRAADLAALLADGGEAAIPHGRKPGRLPGPGPATEQTA